eukprot:m.36411 g.36411  ORF g.36411 m.36411 type:complete len:96 (-) comp11257_c0_seq2:43-330(-)
MFHRTPFLWAVTFAGCHVVVLEQLARYVDMVDTQITFYNGSPAIRRVLLQVVIVSAQQQVTLLQKATRLDRMLLNRIIIDEICICTYVCAVEIFQ